METIFFIISLIWSVLAIVLFFKVWGMTNDVAEIKESIESSGSTVAVSEQGDVVEKFAMAFAQELIAKEIGKTNPQELSFDSIRSFDICSAGGYLVVSEWYITKDSKMGASRNAVRASLVCNDILNYMKPESWEASIL